MDAAKIGALIAQQRRKKNLSQSDLAQLLCVTNKAVSRWETGRGYPDIETLPELAKNLDISISELLNGEICSDLDVPDSENKSITDICAYAGVQRKKQTKVIIWLCAAWVTLVVGIVAVAIADQWPHFYNAVEAILDSLDERQIVYSRGLDVYVYEENHIFFRRCGEVARCEGAYFWMPYEYVDSGDVHAGFYMTHRYYRLGEECYDALDTYFALAGFDVED